VKSITLREVASEAGVSVSTASRVLNQQPFVSADVRERVLLASERLGYRPDVAARAMRTGTTGAVGLVVSDISNPLFASIARAADDVLHPRGFALMVANSANDPAHEAELIAALRQRRLDGLMIAVADEGAPALAERVGSFGAAVLLDREVPHARADSALSDHAAGFASALQHLAGLGHRRVALIAGTRLQRGSRVRIATYHEESARLGLERDPALLREGELAEQDGYHAVREILSLDNPPTAIIAGNNQLFAGMFKALHDLRVRIPQDLSVVACEETELTALHIPQLDVVRRDVEELGAQAASLLLKRIDAPRRRRQQVVLPTTFEARGSTAVPSARRAVVR
jgi:LacI family transcriptional regulator